MAWYKLKGFSFDLVLYSDNKFNNNRNILVFGEKETLWCSVLPDLSEYRNREVSLQDIAPFLKVIYTFIIESPSTSTVINNRVLLKDLLKFVFEKEAREI